MNEYTGDDRRREIHVTCAKEKDWGELHGTLKSIADTQKRIELNQTEIMKRIFGNGKDGIIIVADRNKQAIRRLWWWVGGISMLTLAAAVTIISSHIKSP